MNYENGGGLSPSDVALIQGNRGGNGSNSGFGGDGAWWIVLFLIFALGGWGNNNGGGNSGGGFGGISVHLVQAPFAETYCKELGKAYLKSTGIDSSPMILTAADGATLWEA